MVLTGSQPKDPFLGVAMLKYGSYAFVNGNWVQTIVPASNPNPDLNGRKRKKPILVWTSFHGVAVCPVLLIIIIRDVDGLYIRIWSTDSSELV